MTRSEEELMSRILRPLSVEDKVIVESIIVGGEMRGFLLGAAIGVVLTLFVCWIRGG